MRKDGGIVLEDGDVGRMLVRTGRHLKAVGSGPRGECLAAEKWDLPLGDTLANVFAGRQNVHDEEDGMRKRR